MLLAFALKSEVDVGQRLIVSTVTATAVYCTAMPAPRVLEISRTIVSLISKSLLLTRGCCVKKN